MLSVSDNSSVTKLLLCEDFLCGLSPRIVVVVYVVAAVANIYI
jgi:hypothetical protein